MNTESLSLYLPEYLDGTLEPDLRDEVEHWLAVDPEARAELDALRALKERSAEMPAPEPSPVIAERFFEALGQAQQELRDEAASGPMGWLERIRHRHGWVLQVGYAAMLLGVGLLVGQQWTVRGVDPGVNGPNLAVEIAALKQQVLMSQLNHPSPSERLRGVRYGLEFSALNDEARHTLEQVVMKDESIHVRLAAAQVLFHFIDDTPVRDSLVQLCLAQEDPSVQLLMVSRLHEWNAQLGTEVARKLEQSESTSPRVKQFVNELI